MGVTTTYTCDKCGTVYASGDLMWKVHHVLGYSAEYRTDGGEALWCKPCLQEIGLLCRGETDPPKPVPEPTLADQILAVLESIGITPDGEA